MTLVWTLAFGGKSSGPDLWISMSDDILYGLGLIGVPVSQGQYFAEDTEAALGE